jgi:hypothetical protein
MFNKQPTPTLAFLAANKFAMDARGYAAPSQKYLAVNLQLAGVLSSISDLFSKAIIHT